MSDNLEIILFHYPFSPYARRVIWYLQLRGIPFTQCLQPPTLPRPDLTALGVAYRRIPIVTIGRDIYLDTRLILRKLEQLFPIAGRPLSSRDASARAQEELLERWTVEGGVFTLAAKLIPSELPLLRDEGFQKDREDYTGRSWQMEDVERGRPEALVGMRGCWDLLERMLGDGREWIGGTKEMGLGDIHAVWPFHWLLSLKGALPEDLFGKKQYPRTHAWIGRFSAIDQAKASVPKATTLKGDEAVQRVTQAEFAEAEDEVDEKDPVGLTKGQEVELWPTDTGFKHRDRGRLLSLTKNEIVISATTKVGKKEVRIHAPRAGFRIQAVKEKDAKL